MRLFGAVIVLLLFLVAAALWWGQKRINEAFRGFPEPEVVVTIPTGTSVREGLALLEANGVIRDAALARLYWRFKLQDPVLMAGEYRFHEAATVAEVLGRIRRGEVLRHRVTILEGLTFEEIAAHLSAKGFGSYESFVAQMKSPDRIRDLDPLASDLEGYLFPDTYSFAKGTREDRIVDALVQAFRERFEEALARAGREPRRSLRDVVILASIVEKEALLDEERPIIAGVYDNRLEIGMGLYADPTIIYALKRSGDWDGNIRRRHLSMDSPYNTYRTAGLPPGPICSPGLASLVAAISPADVPYFYFVSRNDGTHVFSRTLAEHNRNVNEWQKLYWQKRRSQDAPR